MTAQKNQGPFIPGTKVRSFSAGAASESKEPGDKKPTEKKTKAARPPKAAKAPKAKKPKKPAKLKAEKKPKAPKAAKPPKTPKAPKVKPAKPPKPAGEKKSNAGRHKRLAGENRKVFPIRLTQQEIDWVNKLRMKGGVKISQGQFLAQFIHERAKAEYPDEYADYEKKQAASESKE